MQQGGQQRGNVKIEEGRESKGKGWMESNARGEGGIENAKMQISIKISDPSVPRENAKGKCIV